MADSKQTVDEQAQAAIRRHRQEGKQRQFVR